jgi:SAM-dependent methyltransferase
MDRSVPARRDAGSSQFWGTMHATKRLALHATIYTWAAVQLQPGWVLDLGCEYGFGSLLIAETNPGLQVLGMDLDFSALGYSQGLPAMSNISRVNASGYKLPIASESFSGIYLINLLHLVDDPVPVLSEASRALKPGGAAIVSIPLEGSGEARHSSRLIERLELEIKDLFSEVIYPKKITGQLPSYKLRTFLLDEQAMTWIAFCRKTCLAEDYAVG